MDSRGRSKCSPVCIQGYFPAALEMHLGVLVNPQRPTDFPQPISFQVASGGKCEHNGGPVTLVSTHKVHYCYDEGGYCAERSGLPCVVAFVNTSTVVPVSDRTSQVEGFHMADEEAHFGML